MLSSARIFFKKYERYVSPVTLVLGFTFDNLTLRRIDLVYSNFLLISYLVVSAASIMLLNIHEARRGDRARSETLHAILVFMMQFCLGGLFSASFLFYSKSGTIIASWPFLLMLFGYIAGNELLRKNYIRLGFQVAVFFTALFSFLIFFLPVILGKMGDSIFLLSGISTLILMGLFIYVLSWFAPQRTRKSAPIIVISLGALFAIINVLYFTNLIPPIPLALKEAGIYRSVVKLDSGSYQVTGEVQQWFSFFAPDPVFHSDPGSTLYALSAVFAPNNLETDIVHEWQVYDDSLKQWKTVNKIDLGIIGGRASGFRTFSQETNIYQGLWRVNVETPRGQLIGRLSFKIASSTGDENLVTDIK